MKHVATVYISIVVFSDWCSGSDLLRLLSKLFRRWFVWTVLASLLCGFFEVNFAYLSKSVFDAPSAQFSNSECDVINFTVWARLPSHPFGFTTIINAYSKTIGPLTLYSVTAFHRHFASRFADGKDRFGSLHHWPDVRCRCNGPAVRMASYVTSKFGMASLASEGHSWTMELRCFRLSIYVNSRDEQLKFCSCVCSKLSPRPCSVTSSQDRVFFHLELI